jgi:phosphoenolpyruvate carboxylase
MADHPLWSDGDQGKRLAELTAGTADPAKELPLRRDVRSLGILLGRALVEQEGESFFGVVEQLRRLMIQHREQEAAPVLATEAGATRKTTLATEPDEDEAMQQARATISGLPVEDAYRLTKAFAIYFELTNLAETNHRKRRRRAAQLQSDSTPVAGSFRGTLGRLL